MRTAAATPPSRMGGTHFASFVWNAFYLHLDPQHGA